MGQLNTCNSPILQKVTQMTNYILDTPSIGYCTLYNIKTLDSIVQGGGIQSSKWKIIHVATRITTRESSFKLFGNYSNQRRSQKWKFTYNVYVETVYILLSINLRVHLEGIKYFAQWFHSHHGVRQCGDLSTHSCAVWYMNVLLSCEK